MKRTILLALSIAAPVSAATTIVRLAEHRYLLTHASGTSDLAGGPIGQRKAREKAATLCAVDGLPFFLVRDTPQQQTKEASYYQTFPTGSTTIDIECVAETRDGALEVRMFPGALVPGEQEKIRKELDAALAIEEKKLRKVERAAAQP